MTRERVAVNSDADSPPPGPSMWQLRFGKRSTTNANTHQNDASAQREVTARVDVGARSPSISEKLLRTLDEASRQKETFSRECADALLGRQNAFASGPELRMPVPQRFLDPATNQDIIDVDPGDVAAEAKKIIRMRLQVEDQADVLRMGQQQRRQHRQHHHRQRSAKLAEGRCVSSTIPENAVASVVSTKGKIRSTVRETPRRQQVFTHDRREIHSKESTAASPTPPPTQECQLRTRRKAAASEGVPPKPDPLPQKQIKRHLQTDPMLKMERRQQKLREAREARKLQTPGDQHHQKLRESVASDNNQVEVLEQQRLEEWIVLLTMENQRAVVLEERLEGRKTRAQSLSRVLSNWQRYVALRRHQETQATAAFQWRTTKRIVSSWRRLTLREIQERVAAETRVAMAREQLMIQRAVRFHRARWLPLWFYHWASVVAQRKEQRAVAAAAEKRRAQTQQLMERMLRKSARRDANQGEEQGQQSEPKLFSAAHSEDVEQKADTRSASSNRDETGGTHSSSHRGILKHPRRPKPSVRGGDTSLIQASAQGTARVFPSQSPLEPPPAPPCKPKRATSKHTAVAVPADPLYQAMEQRAEERKRRREALKRKYEQQEQKRREAREVERAAREALLADQRAEEKARVRERRLAEARALKEKQERREKVLAQRHDAAQHNRHRLLFYYALLPWRRQLMLSHRVTCNARRWHELRELHTHWRHWHAFIQIRRRLRRRHEREQFARAARHEALALQRRALRGWLLVRQLTAARALAVKRQARWNALQRVWKHWHLRLVDVCTRQRRRAYEAAIELQRHKLQRIYQHWRGATLEVQRQRELQHEKEQLWRKVRGWLNEGAD